jgi:single-stranded-DNA-specific exonuclease
MNVTGDLYDQMKRRWVLREEADPLQVSSLSAALGVDRLMATLLIQRGIRDYEAAKSFFRPGIDQLHDPFLMLDMDQAVYRVAQALSRNEKILVYGDYDVDGTTSVALVYTYLDTVCSEKPGYYIPDRYAEGYGISFKGIDFAAEQGYSLIIALDCGIRSADKVDYAREKGIDFIICDHHIPGDIIPNAAAVLDPKRPGCNYPYKELSGCGIGFKLVQALDKHLQTAFDLESLLDLVALSIAADIVPITGENRVLAFFGMQRINKAPRAGIHALLQSGKERPAGREISISDLVFTVAPRINAAGRIEHGARAVEILVSGETAHAEDIGALINQTNSRRRDIDMQMTAEALAMVDSNPELSRKRSTVLFHPEWHKGVVGIVASRVLEKHYRPTVILTLNDGIISGSARSIKDFDIHAALCRCSDLLIQFGGHAFAAGLSLKPEMLKRFIERFDAIASELLSEEQLQETIELDLEIEPAEVNQKFFRILKQFAPFGPGNMAPVLLSRGLIDDGSARIVGNNHLKMRLGKEGQPFFDAIAFGKADHYKMVSQGLPCDVCYTLEENHWNGQVNLQWMVKDIRF